MRADLVCRGAIRATIAPPALKRICATTPVHAGLTGEEALPKSTHKGRSDMPSSRANVFPAAKAENFNLFVRRDGRFMIRPTRADFVAVIC